MTVPTTVARTSQRSQMAGPAGQESGVTMASIRSWLSLVMTSQGSMPGSRRGTAETSTSMPTPPSPGRLAGRAGQARPTEVLDPDHEPGVEQFQAGLDQPLLLEGVTDLDARSLGVVGLPASSPLEAGRCQHAHTADAVAPGARTQQHGQVSRARGDAEHESLGRQRTHAQHVDQGILGVAGIEGQLAPDGGHTDGVAVARDAADHTLDEPALASVVGRPEEQRVHHGQRARPHGEDVAQDPADSGRRSLVGLDGRGVVVALDPHGYRDAVAGVDHPSVLTGSDQHLGPLRRQPARCNRDDL